TWDGAQEYCRWLSAKTGQDYRLPTQAEWEYAARGGQKADPKRPLKYAGSDNLDEVAWYSDNSNDQTHPVGGKKANALGLYDMSGNVWELCADWYGENYYEQLAKGGRNPAGPVTGEYRLLRGGSWYDETFFSRSADRLRYQASVRSNDIGFRLARH
ncbi:MAG: formylglycine-generating enzyme family protein, partial [Saprospiraceae bacterium]|nr:formylglycine-generating enzyme family protein [Saprospiraceae bacterium]